MLREYTEVVSETVNEGFARGVDLFMESLEYDLQKDAVFTEHGEEAVLEALMSEDLENPNVNAIQETD